MAVKTLICSRKEEVILVKVEEGPQPPNPLNVFVSPELLISSSLVCESRFRLKTLRRA